MIAAKGFVIRIDPEQFRLPRQADTGLLGQFTSDGLERSFAGLNPAARQMPAIDIGVADQCDMAVRSFCNGTHPQGCAARQTPAGLHEGARERLDLRPPPHTETGAGHSGSGTLCTVIAHAFPETFSMYALIAVGLVVAVFAILNLIEFRRLD